jgi:hypothetical protein
MVTAVLWKEARERGARTGSTIERDVELRLPDARNAIAGRSGHSSASSKFFTFLRWQK